MKIYSNGKDRTLTGSFPARFKLLNNGVEVPFIRTGKGSVRLSGEIPFGELDVEEVIKQKTPQPAKLDAQSIAIINKSDFDKIDILSKKLAINQEQMNAHLSALTEQEATLANLETQNAQAIEQVNVGMAEMAGVFGKEIQADRERIKATAKSIAQDIAVSSEVLNAKIEVHEKAKNPHKITKETIGLDKVENTSDLDKPVSKATQKALDKKADKSDIEDVRKEIKATEKKQERLVKSIDNANLYGGIGGNELPTGGKKGQILGKKSNKTGDYEWLDNSASPTWGSIGGNINNQTDLKNALDAKQDVISDLDTIRSGASAGATAVQPDDVGNATLTIQKNGSSEGTFTANSKTDTTINISVPTDTSDLTNGAGYITSSALNGYATQTWVGQQGFLTSTALANYVTTNTSQIITGQKTFKRTETQFQDSVARFVSTYNSSTDGWRGRVIIGAKDYTFLIGTYNGMAAIGGHKFTDSSTESGATWSDIYFQPDGDKAVYFGGWSWTQNSGWFKVKNNASNTSGQVQVNTGTITSANWKDVAYKGENISHFNNDANYITSASIGNATLKIQKNGTDVATFTANSSTDATANITVPTDTNDLTNGAGYITGITSSDVTTALGYTPYNSSNPSGYQANVIETVKVNGSALTPSNKAVDITVPTQASDIGAQATLVSGTNIKTVNSQSLLGSGNIEIQSAPDVDSKSISLNSSDELQTVGVIDQNDTSTALKQWSGTKAQYDAIVTKDPDTLYNITDDVNPLSILETIYPVGSIYIGTMSTCPLAALFGTWTLKSSGRVLQGADANHSAGSTIEAGLPNITSNIQGGGACYQNRDGGALYTTDGGDANIGGTTWTNKRLYFDASKSNSIYGNSTTVQPPAYVVNIWERTA